MVFHGRLAGNGGNDMLVLTKAGMGKLVCGGVQQKAETRHVLVQEDDCWIINTLASGLARVRAVE